VFGRLLPGNLTPFVTKVSTKYTIMRAKEFTSIGESKERFVEMFQRFLPLCMEILKLDSLPRIIFAMHIKDTHQPTFGRYNNDEQTLEVALANRHPNDILRTIAHELQHYKQGQEHRLGPDAGDTGSPIENEANAMAGIVMRNFNKQYPEYLGDRPIVAENFADGRNPQDKGDSKRHGVPTKASVSTLRKVAKQGGRKGQLAHWMANMKAGRAKKKK
jgi:hypothetical protein